MSVINGATFMNGIVQSDVVFLNQKGFTLIELILIILMLGIMASTILPKMFSTDGFSENAYVNEVVNKLRAIQLRAMQQTDGANSACHNVLITSKTLSNDPDVNDTSDSCDLWASGSTKVEITEENISFDLSNAISFSFDSWGRPQNCTTTCDVVILGREGSLTVRIENEGYIHALP